MSNIHYVEDFVIAYMIAALWSSNDESDERGGEPMDSNYSIDDIAPETKETMLKECQRFIEEDWDDLQEIPNGGEYNRAERAGHDFWLTRNHHGAGFWDRGLGAVGKRLTEAARKGKGRNLYVRDDGMIYQDG